MKLFMSHSVFPTPDIRRTAEFYHDKLGFRRVDYLDAEEKHICLYRDGVELILTQSSGRAVLPNHVLYGYGGDAYVITDDLRELQAEYEGKGVNIVHRLHRTDYHNREFAIEDCDGRWVYFGIKDQHFRGELLYEQLARDYCCTAEDVEDCENHFTVYRPLDGRRRFDKEEKNGVFLKIAAFRGKLLVSGREDIIKELSEKLRDTDGAWFMEAKSLARLNGIIGAYGYRIAQAHPFFTAEHQSDVSTAGYEIRWYDQTEIENFRGDERFDEAFAFSEAAPDVLGVAAVKDGVILGMAGASADSPDFRQVGINVGKENRGQGIGTMLVTLLKNEILKRGFVPYYGTAMSHIASQRVALHAGFLPAWTELYAEKKDG